MAFFDVDRIRRAIEDRLDFYQAVDPPTPESVEAILTLQAILDQLPEEA